MAQREQSGRGYGVFFLERGGVWSSYSRLKGYWNVLPRKEEDEHIRFVGFGVIIEEEGDAKG